VARRTIPDEPSWARRASKAPTARDGEATVEATDIVDVRAGTVVLDDEGRVRVPRGGANVAALLRIGLGLLYFWAFISQGFGVAYTNTETTAPGQPVEYGWHFSYDADAGWITSGFAHSPTGAYIDKTHGPLAWIVQDLPVGVDDFGWMFAIGGLGIALTLGICMRIAGWGGFALNILIWFSGFPPSGNPLIDGDHMAFALSVLLLMYLHADNRFGLGRWWRARTPALLH
jgi:thiosulfate dehydrogenase [quinone] large subunit